MRVAVLITGLPRFLEQGSYRLKKIFENCNFTVDYYCHFWDNYEPNLNTEIEKYYNPVKKNITKYDSYITNIINIIKDKNAHCNLLHLFNDNFQNTFLFKPLLEYIGSYSKNIYGQYLSCFLGSKLINYDNYDIIIKTRSDVILKPIIPKKLEQCLQNILINPYFNNCIFPVWLKGTSQGVLFGDFCFVSPSPTWKNYSCNLEENLINLLTKDKLYLWDMSHNNMIPHYMWQKLSYRNNNNWLSITVSWPIDFNATLWRQNDHLDYKNSTWNNIEYWYRNNNLNNAQ